ncbi:MAG: hypothetical protein AAFP69_03185 [Planctomycetota bacterium]
MGAIYEGLGIRFVYPENWTLSYTDEGDPENEESWTDNDISVTFETPDGAFVSINRYAPSPSSGRLLETAAAAIQKEFPDVEREAMPVCKSDLATLMDCDSVGEQEEGLELNFFVLDLIVSVRLIAIPHRNSTYLVHLQAELNEFEQMEMVFAAILKQIRESLDTFVND